MTDIETLEQALKRIRVAQATHTALPYNLVCEDIEKFITKYKTQLKILDALEECLDDTWQCEKCGHSEPWWKNSNAHYLSNYPAMEDKDNG
jgi:hypothetical protein